MAIANHFYNETTKKYVALFGSIFNKISIVRNDKTDSEVQRLVVPISYGPYQKFMAKIQQDPNLDNKTAITLPRMSFEMNSFVYDGTRKVNSLSKLPTTKENTNSGTYFHYSPAPYNIDFTLSIMVKYAEDGAQIMEQIIPFFKPERTTTVKLMDNIEPIDIPLILNSVSVEDVYDGDFETRRSLLWNLEFTMKCWYFGPERDKKVIKFIDVREFTNTDDDTIYENKITIQPGLTANGEPTTDANTSITYTDIMEDDDWGLIVSITENEDE